jgi:hypothetical protein
MEDATKPKLTAKEAVKAAFREFHDFYEDTVASYVLLDGVRYDEERDEWVVTIGFDIGRTMSTNLGFFGDKREPSRERRTFYLDGDTGEFLRIA